MNKAVIALGMLVVLAAAAWKTMEPGKIRLVVLVILGSFALRILLASRTAR